MQEWSQSPYKGFNREQNPEEGAFYVEYQSPYKGFNRELSQ